jgi:hypothetical protein
MVRIPGWDSIDTTTRIHNFAEFWGIVGFLIVVGLEFVAYFYGHRRDWLVDDAARVAGLERQQAEKATEQRHAAEAEAMRQQLAAAEQKAAQAIQRTAPRTLPRDQAQGIINALAPFSGQQVEFWCLINNDESKRFAEDILAAISAAKWDTRGGINQMLMGGPDPIGVQVLVNDAYRNPKDVPQPAVVLMETLATYGFMGREIGLDPKVPLTGVKIIIGVKPQK